MKLFGWLSKLVSKNPLSEFGENVFAEATQNPRVLTCGSVIVAYRFSMSGKRPSGTLKAFLTPEETDDKIREILIANPDADLAPLEPILGITIVEIQRPKLREDPKGMWI